MRNPTELVVFKQESGMSFWVAYVNAVRLVTKGGIKAYSLDNNMALIDSGESCTMVPVNYYQSLMD